MRAHISLTITNQTIIHVLLFFRLNSSEYRDLKDKVQAPVVNARNVVITQSLTDRFLEAFREQVAHNPRYQLPEGSVVSIIYSV